MFALSQVTFADLRYFSLVNPIWSFESRPWVTIFAHFVNLIMLVIGILAALGVTRACMILPEHATERPLCQSYALLRPEEFRMELASWQPVRSRIISCLLRPQANSCFMRRFVEDGLGLWIWRLA